MEDFTRTADGLANAHLFHDADFIVYCESDVDKNRETCWDIGFWQKVLSCTAPDKRFYFKPQGGKSQVLKISNLLRGRLGHKSICAIDRDFSDIQDDVVYDVNVVFTYGYSFENDICDEDIMMRAILSSIPGEVDVANLITKFQDYRKDAERKLRWMVRADQMASLHHISFIPRDTGRFRILFNASETNAVPSVNFVRASERMSAIRAHAPRGSSFKHAAIDGDVWRRLYGHACWWINYRIARFILKKVAKIDRISEDAFAAMVMTLFSMKLANNDWIVARHHRQQAESAMAAVA